MSRLSVVGRCLHQSYRLFFLDDASLADRKIIKEDLGIKAVLDLRTKFVLPLLGLVPLHLRILAMWLR
jgi:hypothetical protein